MSKRSGAATRERLVAEAAVEMAREGFRAMSVDVVLRRVGVTKGSFYYHFPTKRDLGRAVLREVARESALSLWRKVAERDGDPIPAVVDVLTGLEAATDGVAIRGGCSLAVFAADVAAHDEALREEAALILRERVELVANALERGRDAGTVRGSTRPREAADFLLAAVDGIRATARVTRDADAYRASLRALRLLVQTLRPGVALRVG